MHDPRESVTVSMARTAAVPTAITLDPASRVWLTSRAVVSGTRYRSVSGTSPSSNEATPPWSTSGANTTPLASSEVSSLVVKGRPALGISADPGSVA